MLCARGLAEDAWKLKYLLPLVTAFFVGGALFGPQPMTNLRSHASHAWGPSWRGRWLPGCGPAPGDLLFAAVDYDAILVPAVLGVALSPGRASSARGLVCGKAFPR